MEIRGTRKTWKYCVFLPKNEYQFYICRQTTLRHAHMCCWLYAYDIKPYLRRKYKWKGKNKTRKQLNDDFFSGDFLKLIKSVCIEAQRGNKGADTAQREREYLNNCVRIRGARIRRIAHWRPFVNVSNWASAFCVDAADTSKNVTYVHIIRTMHIIWPQLRDHAACVCVCAEHMEIGNVMGKTLSTIWMELIRFPLKPVVGNLKCSTDLAQKTTKRERMREGDQKHTHTTALAR